MVLATYCNVASSILETRYQEYDAEILDCSIFPDYGEMFGKVDSGHSILRGLCIKAIEYDRTFPELVGRNLPRSNEDVLLTFSRAQAKRSTLNAFWTIVNIMAFMKTSLLYLIRIRLHHSMMKKLFHICKTCQTKRALTTRGASGIRTPSLTLPA